MTRQWKIGQHLEIFKRLLNIGDIYSEENSLNDKPSNDTYAMNISIGQT